MSEEDFEPLSEDQESEESFRIGKDIFEYDYDVPINNSNCLPSQERKPESSREGKISVTYKFTPINQDNCNTGRQKWESPYSQFNKIFKIVGIKYIY